MKKIIFGFGLLLFSLNLSAQKYGYIDSEYILDNIPEYKVAQQKLDSTSAAWQNDVETQYNDIDKMFRKYQSDKILLTDDMRLKREQDIVNKESDVKALQKKRFGPEGDLFKKRQELVKPIQDKIFSAIKKLADDGGYAFIFDKANSASLIYTDTKYDKSDAVLKAIGYKQ